MGIKGLRDLLKKQLPSYEERVPMKNFENKKIVVDVSLYICMYKAARKEMYEEMFMTLFTALLEHNIHPTFVFDGQSPKEKSNEKKKRADKKDASIARVQKLENDLEQYNKTGDISQDLHDINAKVRSTQIIMSGRTQAARKTSGVSSSDFSSSKVKQYIEKLRGNILNITESDFQNVRELLTMFGIPYITAAGEAEVICAELVKRGIADAVMTKDTDVLACCVPIMLYDVDIGAKEFTQIKTETILSGLDLDEASWLDLCIMCGTDFNDNIPRIGPVTSLKYIKKYKNIETIGESVTKPKQNTKLDISALAHEKTRTLFRCDDVPEELVTGTKPDLEKIEQRIKDKRLKISVTTIRRRLGIDMFDFSD
ncbi:DNA repair protein RAD2 [carnivorous sponge associated iridovirus]|nr:DNA repair protein RAD2 [carnivorous sponge associated iridovirus]